MAVVAGLVGATSGLGLACRPGALLLWAAPDFRQLDAYRIPGEIPALGLAAIGWMAVRGWLAARG